MKKYLFLLFLFLSFPLVGFSICVLPDESKCEPLRINCPKGTIYTLHNNQDKIEAACIPCDSAEDIKLSPYGCTSKEEALKICPNRYIKHGCGPYSVLSCTEDKEKVKEPSFLYTFFFPFAALKTIPVGYGWEMDTHMHTCEIPGLMF